MVWDVLLAAGVGGFAGASVQAWMSKRNTDVQVEAAHDRRIGELFWEKKVDALTEYHQNLELLWAEILLYRNNSIGDGLTKEEVKKELSEIYNDYYLSMTAAAAFLTEEQYNTLNDSLGPLREACKGIVDNVEKDTLEAMAEADDWNDEELSEAADAAEKVVKGEIREGLERLEKEDSEWLPGS